MSAKKKKVTKSSSMSSSNNVKAMMSSKESAFLQDGKAVVMTVKESTFLHDGGSRASSTNSSSNNTDMMKYPPSDSSMDIGRHSNIDMNHPTGPVNPAGTGGNHRDYNRLPPGMYPNNYNGSFANRNSFPDGNHDDGAGGVMLNGSAYPPGHNPVPGKPGFGATNNSIGSQLPGYPPDPAAQRRGIPAGYAPSPLSLHPTAGPPPSPGSGFADGRGPGYQGYALAPTPMLNQLLQYSSYDEKHQRMYDDYRSKCWPSDEQSWNKAHSNQVSLCFVLYAYILACKASHDGCSMFMFLTAGSLNC